MTPATGRRVRTIALGTNHPERAGDQNVWTSEGHVKRVLIAGVAGLVAVGAVSASAASFGTVTSDGLGAAAEAVASCDSDGITVDYTVAYDAAAAIYEVSSVELSGVDAGCDGLTYDVALSDGTSSLGSATGTVSLTTGAMSIDVSSSNASAEAVTDVALAIVG